MLFEKKTYLYHNPFLLLKHGSQTDNPQNGESDKNDMKTCGKPSITKGFLHSLLYCILLLRNFVKFLCYRNTLVSQVQLKYAQCFMLMLTFTSEI